MTKPIWTDGQIINQLNTGYFWSTPVITYAFLTNRSQIEYDDGEAAGFSPFNATQRQLTELSLATWNDLIAPQIVLGTPGQSDIEFGNTSTGVDYGYAYFPKVGTVWLNTNYAKLNKPVFGGYDAQTYIHEIGHALGLDHMGNYDGAYDYGPSSYQDSSVYTVMSYYGPSDGRGKGDVAWGDWRGLDGKWYAPQTPMINDIMAIQSIYGAAVTREGDTVYGFGSNVTGPLARIYDFSLNQNPVLAIYDSGGIDTLNISGWSTSSQIDLRPGQFSSTNGMVNNLSIARGVLIENVITGAGDDFIRVNSATNRLDGGAGYDTVLFNGSQSSYLLNYDPLNAFYIATDRSDIDGTNVLVNIEAAAFSDYTNALENLTLGVHRFYNPSTGTHFFTANNGEAKEVAQSGMSYEGTQFARSMFDTNLTTEVHRFYNSGTDTHFYTANVEETADLKENAPFLQYEGLAYLAYSQKTDTSTELYRFFNIETGTHFYTANLAEKELVKINLAGQYQYEGVAFYVDVV